MALYTPKEIAAHLRVCPETVKRLTASGKIPGVKVGAQYRYDLDAVGKALQATQERTEEQAQEDQLERLRRRL